LVRPAIMARNRKRVATIFTPSIHLTRRKRYRYWKIFLNLSFCVVLFFFLVSVDRIGVDITLGFFFAFRFTSNHPRPEPNIQSGPEMVTWSSPFCRIPIPESGKGRGESASGGSLKREWLKGETRHRWGAVFLLGWSVYNRMLRKKLIGRFCGDCEGGRLSMW
jgi:hypothetical protein